METLSSTEPPKVVTLLATIGRIGLTVTGLIALIAVISTFDNGSIFTILLGVIGALGMMTCAVVGLIKPMRVLDLGAVLLAAMLVGSFAVFGFGFDDLRNFSDDYGISVLSLLSWMLTLAFGGLLAVGLAFGPPVVNEGFKDQMTGLFTSSNPAPAPGQYAPPAQQYAPPTQQYAPPAQQYPPPAQEYPPPTAPAEQFPPPAAETAQPGPVEDESDPDTAAEEAAPTEVGVDAATAEETGTAAAGSEEQAPAGWYPQADGVTARYWTGTEWSDDIRPISELT